MEVGWVGHCVLGKSDGRRMEADGGQGREEGRRAINGGRWAVNGTGKEVYGRCGAVIRGR